MSKFFKYSVLKKYNLFFTIFVLFIFFSSFTKAKDEPKHKVKTVVIDAGHGGKDPGCSGHIHNEKTVALAVALKLGKYIEEHIKDVRVIYTRKTDVFVDLEDRAKIANDNNADLFISIHCNAAGKPVLIKDKVTGKMRPKTYKNKKGKVVVVETSNPEPYGSETYVMGLKNEEGKMKVAQRENSVILLEDNYESKYQGFDPDSQESYIIMSNYTSAYVLQSAGLAMKIQEEYSKKASRVNKGVHRQSIWVLWRTGMPSVLTEIGYLTNPQEELFLGSDKGQTYMAACLFRAFRKYKDEVEGRKLVYDDEFENQKPLEKEVHISYKEQIPNQTEADNTIDKSSKRDTNVVKAQVISDNAVANEVVNQLNNALDDEAYKQKKYRQLVVLADLNFRNKNYSDAKSFYNQAIKLNITDDLYPSKRIKSLDSIENIIKNEGVSTIEMIQPPTKKEQIVFKVQFASSEKEMDYKTTYTQLKDLSFYKVGQVFKYTSGQFQTFEEATQRQIELRDLGFKDCFVVAFKEGLRMDITEAKKIVGTN
jgi:N-acetylmuramoyl-L-alanine amidase